MEEEAAEQEDKAELEEDETLYFGGVAYKQ